MFVVRPLILTAIGLLAVATIGCSTDDSAQSDADGLSGQPTMTTDETDDGLIVEFLDTNGDGNADIIRYFEEYEDPRDDTRIRRRLRKLEIDNNNDDTINVRRFYDDHGNVEREENDQNLDGNIDTILEFTGGELSRKQIKDQSGEYIQEQRIYYEGQLVRVETDSDGNGDINRWEYYEDEVLMRIGLDTNGDGSADTWQLR